MKFPLAPGLGLMVLVACMTEAGPSLAIPNPSSVFCEEARSGDSGVARAFLTPPGATQ